jgi:hypothetical protein
MGSSPRPALADLAAALECNPLPVDAIVDGRSDLAPPGIPAGMTADHRASEFLEKCHGLPLHPGDRVAIEGIERNIRCGLWKYRSDQAILGT